MPRVTTPRSLISPASIREASLPKSLRGLDEAATRTFLNKVAETVQTLMNERDKLRESLLETERARIDPENPAAIGNVLLAAQRAGEELVAHAYATAEQITAGAKEASERLLRRDPPEDDRRRARARGAPRAKIENLRADAEAERRTHHRRGACGGRGASRARS